MATIPQIRAASEAAFQTVADVVVSVATTGDDSPTVDRPATIVGGDYSAFPFLTVQAAIDAIPKTVRYPAEIKVGPGSFEGFTVEGFHCGNTAVLSISGTRDTATLATGPNSGLSYTSKSGRDYTITGAGWTVDDLAGKHMEIVSGPFAGQIFLIAGNTSDTFYLAEKTFLVFSSSVFNIVEATTLVDSIPSGNFYGIGLFQNTGNLIVSDFECSVGQGGKLAASANSYLDIRRTIATSGAGRGFYIQDSGRVTFRQCGAIGCSGQGFSIYNVSNVPIGNYGLLTKDCGAGPDIRDVDLFNARGIVVRQTAFQIFIISNCRSAQMEDYLIDGGWTGIAASNVGELSLRSGDISNVIVNCFSLQYASLTITGTGISGSGNTGWGLNAKGPNNKVHLTSPPPTVSGTLGEVTVDGTTDVTWAALTTLGSYAEDIPSGSRIFKT